ncbi:MULTISPECIES: hypothetical protein [unclassified Tenacibaculum]|uniref:hypothetical protein n=1 Tax=unclassified Tenacibaculum TaxID=2635139 RepID=UPI001F26C530|nr:MULTISPECIES: hypothetical protein [unclassified Tenacibaculum]MCF2874885.1 hypothetical protein [Tenacibaculum sp. Cn5-1]MCF2934049.1 hypothetical protein [Tenacibaculum sp. Cn5-34]MCG7510259.1 hypothetical protein [Tenacibaculum sp. Cn5-46]
MRKAIKNIALFTIPLFVACGGGGSSSGGGEVVNDAPTKVDLVFPTENLLCIDNTITFDWSDATDPNSDAITYKVEISKNRDMTNIVKTQTASTSEASITLDKGVAFYWRVTATDSKGKSGDASSVFAFYTKGTGVLNVAPFTAELTSPAMDSSVSGTTVSLEWKGADSNTGDTLKYDVYFGENADPQTKEGSLLTTNTLNVTVASGKTYYWKVNTIDDSGAKSIGQIWSFKVN